MTSDKNRGSGFREPDVVPTESERAPRSVFPEELHANVFAELQRLVSGGAADFFYDACALVSGERDFHSKSHLLAHLTREVASAVRSVVAALPGVQEGADTLGQDESRKSALVEELCAGGVSRVDATRSVGLLSQNADFDGVFRPKARNVAEAAVEVLQIDDPEICEAIHDVLASSSWHRFAHRSGLNRPRTYSTEFRTEWDKFVGSLSVVLRALEGRFAAVFKKLDVLKSVDSPTKKDCQTVAQELPRVSVVLAHFFDGLSSAWLPGLHKQKLFANPPLAIHDGAYTRFPAWPQSKYLARVASEAPELVCDIILGMRETDNVFVRSDLCSAAMAMPAKYAEKVLSKQLRWVSSLETVDGITASSVEEVTEKLLELGLLRLLDAYLRCVLSLRRSDRRHDPEAKVDSWDYRRLVDGALAGLAKADPAMAAQLLTDLLVEGHGEKTSSGWRAAIEEHGQNYVEGPMDFLLAQLRGIYETKAAQGPGEFQTVFGSLSSSEHSIFRRLGLHLLRIHGSSNPALVADASTNIDLLNDHECRHEMMEMVAAQLPLQAPDAAQKIIAAMKLAKSPEKLSELADRNGYELTPEEAEERSLWALRDWLWTIGSENLPDEDAAMLEDLVERFGAPSHPTFSGWWESWVGEPAPLTTAELASLPDDALLEYLRDWTPTERGFRSPNKSGLASALQDAVVQDRARFSRLALRFRALDPPYISAVLSALWRKHSEPLTGEEEPIVALCEAIALRDDHDFSQSIGHWLEGLLRDPRGLNDDLLERVWQLVYRNMGSPDPDQACVDRSDVDGINFAISTTRGRSLDLASDLFCALREQGQLSEPQARVVEEIRAAISRRVTDEPCRSVLAVLARSFNRLFGADQAYAESLCVGLFDADDPGMSTFSAFLSFNGPRGPTVDCLRSVYERALDHLGTDEQFDGCLGKHLIWLATWGHLSQDDLAKFVEKAMPQGRASALADLGRALSNTAELEPEDQRAIQQTWSVWFNAMSETAVVDDLTEFGWWFVGRCLDADWRLNELAKVLSQTHGRIDWDHKVIEELARLAPGFPRKVIECLSLCITGKHRGFAYPLSRHHLAACLEILIANLDTTDWAQELVSVLAARGETEYLRLLPAGQSGD